MNKRGKGEQGSRSPAEEAPQLKSKITVIASASPRPSSQHQAVTSFAGEKPCAS